jgi:anti-sigma factor RsiW
VTCREFADFIMSYVSGELSGDPLATFERHLQRCQNCKRYLAGYQESTALGRAAFDDAAALPDDVPEDLVKAILAARPRP